VKFQVFQDGKIVDRFRLCGAYLFGTDGIGIRRAKIRFKNGIIECERPNLETAGLALLWPANGFGRMLLPTTCLPERERPYNLNLEIARAKFMQIINKREDWSLFDGMDDLQDTAKQAQEMFTRAIQNNSDPEAASQFADESLKMAIILAEKLAIKQAESFFNTRIQNNGFGKGCFGCSVNHTQINNPEYVNNLLEVFGSVTIPINWAHIEPQRGSYDFSMVDSCINALAKKKLVIGAGPLLRFSKDYLPKWLIGSKMGFEKIRETSYQFVLRMVARYSGIIHRWVVLSGLNLFNNFGFTFEQILGMTRAVNMAVKAASNRAQRIVEISNLWGEYFAIVPNTIPPLAYMDMIVQSGINFDAFGLAVRFGKNFAGMHVRDMMQISAVLDYFGPIGKPLYITGVEVPSRDGEGLCSSKVAGTWHQEWDQLKQAEWIEQFYKIALSKPYVDSVTYSVLSDTKGSIVANSGLLTEGFEPKKSFQTIKKLHDEIFN
jgi:hypothetical protein